MAELNPLAGIQVLEIGSSVSGPSATEILAMMGARSIKLEAPAGDPTRAWGPSTGEQRAIGFEAFNREKESIVIDLKTSDGMEQLWQLMPQIDVVVQNLRPGLAKKMGIDADSMRERFPKLVYCTIGAYGDAGPMKNRPGYDPLAQAFAGIMSVTGEPDRPPVRVPVPIIDLGTGMWAALGVLGALQGRSRTGVGAAVSTSLLETALAWEKLAFAEFMKTGEIPKPTGASGPVVFPNGAYTTSDGELMVTIGTDTMFATFARLVAAPEWAEDPCYSANQARLAHADQLTQAINEKLCVKTRDEWVEIFDQHNIPNSPIQNFQEIYEHPQFKALGMLQEHPDGSIPLLGLPIRFDGVRPSYNKIPPKLGDYQP